MTNTLLMRGFQRFEYLPGDVQRFFDGKGTTSKPICERLPFDKLQYQKLDGTGQSSAVRMSPPRSRRWRQYWRD